VFVGKLTGILIYEQGSFFYFLKVIWYTHWYILATKHNASVHQLEAKWRPFHDLLII